MKTIAAACLLLSGCTDAQNLGNTTTTTNPPLFSQTRWALSFGSVDQDGARGLALDSTGDAIAAGYFKGTVDFGTETLTAPHTSGFVSKRAGADGSELWTLTFGTEASAIADAADVEVGADDSVIVAGTYAGDFHLEQQVLYGPQLTVGTDCFVAKYDPAGHLQWVRGLGAASLCDNDSIAVGQDGRIALVGSYQGTLALPNGTFTASEPDSFLVMFDANGNMVWGTVGTKGMTVTSVAMTAEDDVILSGDIYDHTTYNGTLMVANAYETQYVARWTVDGHLLWAGAIGAPGISQEAGPIAIDANGAAIIGSTRRPDSPAGDNGKPEISEIDPTGHFVWTVQAASGSAFDYALTRLTDGTVVTGGPTEGSLIDFGNGTLKGCIVLAAYKPNGTLADAISFMEPASGCNDAPYRLANRPGSVAFAGVIDHAGDFGTGTVRFAGGLDAIIVMMDTAD